MTSTIRVADILGLLAELAPRALAEPWDPVGLQVGDPAAAVSSVLVALEATPAVVTQAAAQAGTLLVTHHPAIFRPMAGVRADDPTGRLVAALVRAGTALIACHTNWDKAPGGTDESLAAVLGLVDPRPLQAEECPLYRISVMVAEDDLDAVRDAMAAAGAGEGEHYRRASFSVPGESTYEALPGSSPAYGGVGVFTLRAEHRLEMVTTEQALERVVQAILAVHPYEEPAYGVDRLARGRPLGGLGRIGHLPEAVALGAWAGTVRDMLGAPGVRVVGDPARPVRTVASVGGSGRSLVTDAARAGADVLVTADIGHHDARLAEDLGIGLIDAGHRETEQPGVRALAVRLGSAMAAQGMGTVPVRWTPVAAPFAFRV